MMDALEMADVRVFAAGIEPANVASVRCAMAAGMTPATTTPDDEGIIHYLRRRELQLAVLPGEVGDAADGWLAAECGVGSVIVVGVSQVGKAARRAVSEGYALA